MSRDDIQKLLGGYATGTLTPAEQQALFEAALDGQELFDELAREQALRDVLSDPAARAHLLTALDARPPRWWITWWRPAAAAMAMAGVVVLAVMVVRNSAPKPAMWAIMKPAAPMMAPEQERDSSDAVRLAAPPPAPAPVRERRPASSTAVPEPSARAVPRRSADLAANKLTSRPAAEPSAAGATAAAGSTAFVGGAPTQAALPPPPAPASPPPPAALEKKADAVPVKTEVSLAKDVTQESLAMVIAEAKRGASAKTLFLQGQVALGAGRIGFADTYRQPGRQGQQGQQQQGQQQRASPSAQQQASPSAQQQAVQSAEALAEQAPQSNLSRARQAGAQNSAGQIAASTVFPLGVCYSLAPVVGLRFETNMPIAADRAALHVETNANGYLYAWARGEGGPWRPLATFSVVRLQSYTAPPLRPGEKEVLVLFSRQARASQSAAPSSGPTTNLVEKDGDLTYVVNPVSGAGQVLFTIRFP